MSGNSCNDCYRCYLIGLKLNEDDDHPNNIYISGKLYYYRNYYNNEDGYQFHINLLKKCCYLRYYGIYTNLSNVEKNYLVM
jgi:hypothetical protein